MYVVQKCISIGALAKESNIYLPESVLKKFIAVNYSDQYTRHEYFLKYDHDHHRLYFQYMQYDDDCENYWDCVDVGYILDDQWNDIDEEIADLEEKNSPYFFVATYKHSDVIHYPVRFREEAKTGISGIFIPSNLFVKECDNDLELLLKRLQSYFKEYTDWCNGEVYIVCQSIFDLGSNDNLLFPEESDSCGSFIGFDHAKEALSTVF